MQDSTERCSYPHNLPFTLDSNLASHFEIKLYDK